MSSEKPRGEMKQQSGHWLGELEGIRVCEPGPDADGAIVEIHGKEDMSATEIRTERLVDKLRGLAAEIQLILDEVDDE